jgi:Heterokaryon incompatibility protein (HET)
MQINEKALHSAFQDAITVARDISLYHIWIDSLCVIQDAPEEEKLREVFCMDDVYSSAMINICAKNASTGIKPTIRPHCSKHATHPRFLIKSGLWVGFQNSLRDEVVNGPLTRRGWVMQETIFAIRTLYVSAYGMHWQCQECSDSGSPDLFSKSPSLRRRIETRDIGWNTWLAIVHEFTGRKLSSRLDVIRAIHGVAMLMSKTFQIRFFTGLWEHSLHQDLLWERSECTSSCPPFPHEYDPAVDSPTWSWASVQGQVDCPGVLASVACVDKDGNTLVTSVSQMTTNGASGSFYSADLSVIASSY